MDKFRAIQYFNHAVERGSFAAAARSLDVSTPAVMQMISALEREVGVVLFHRTTRGLSLTADGERYYETSRRIAAELNEIEQRLAPRAAKPRGTLTVGMRAAVARYVMPRIGRFLELLPDVDLVTRPVVTADSLSHESIDVVVMVGWPPNRDLVVRPLAQTRHVICASMEYWSREGKPAEPDDLRRHHCLVIRNASGVLLDRWIFEKNGDRRTIDVRSRLFTDDTNWMLDAACAGAGVVRLIDIAYNRFLASGPLVPVLTDWEAIEAPIVYAAYRPKLRHSRLVRAFLHYLVEVFSELERAPVGAISRVPKPEWFDRARGRQSTYVARGKKPG